jgi:lipopolysaccharide biosynthesis glycosyltransferase
MKKINWFSGINKMDNELFHDYRKMYEVAVLSSIETNPDIQPYLIFDGDDYEFEHRISKLGVKIIKHKSSFSEQLLNHYKDERLQSVALGAFLRIDIPLICKKENIECDYYLYTDNDVMFIKDITEIIDFKPLYFGCSGEFSKNFSHFGLNSGVMWVNKKQMEEDYEKFVEFIKNNLDKFNVFDQDAYKIFYSGKVEELHYKFNYKPYWGIDNDISIIHFHGPKPTITDEDIPKFPYPNLFGDFFFEMKEKFKKIYDNHYLLNS